jgi:Tfp pilus assembly protein PilX
MASQVLSGTNTNLTYTNNTGQNVRVVINYLRCGGGISVATMTAGNMSIQLSSGNTVVSIGRNLAFIDENSSTNGLIGNNAETLGTAGSFSAPTEVMLSSGQVFSVTGSSTYNIVIIPEVP